MMWRIWGFTLIVSLIITNHRAYGAGIDTSSQNTVEYVSDAAPQDAHYDVPDTNIPFISINTDMRRDLNWAAALEFSDPALRPMPVVLPLLENYPFDNLEIKLRVLNLKF
ncbi:MAG: hypothetical protein K2M34_02400 [Alphaproteobacteria bacterium]|nr:hypothetical protein [Alphaproteobacteria bacterium]